jgi:imidazolonepropionase-like amidohydrolase
MLSAAFALKKVRLYDGVGENPVPDALLLVRNGKILFAGPSQDAPPYTSEQTLDGQGGTVLPGFIDLHVHALSNEKGLRSLAANGVTTLRDLAAPALQAVEWRMRERRGEEAGLPRIYACGPVLTCEGGYPSNEWGPDVAAVVSGRFQAQEKVRRLLGMGLDVVKLGLDHESGPCLSLTEASAAVEAAHELGKRVTAHVTDARDFELALHAGVDETAHLPSRPIPDNLWKEAVARGLVILPTLRAHAGWAEEWGRLGDHRFARQSQEGFREGYRQALKNLARFLDFGGKVAYGSDAGNPRMPFGVSIEEWQDLRRCGLSPTRCLRMATSDAAEALGEGSRLGRLQEGYAADFCLYRRDPLQNPEDFRAIEWTMKGGEWIAPLPMERPAPFDLGRWIHPREGREKKR